MSINYVPPPQQIDPCWRGWSETDQSVLIRTDVEAGPPMVRRRFTGTRRVATVDRRMRRSEVRYLHDWYRTLCKQGSRATLMVEPDGTVGIWRFVEPPQVRWVDQYADYAEITATIEQMPAWFGVAP